jgi:hypothetical protein
MALFAKKPPVPTADEVTRMRARRELLAKQLAHAQADVLLKQDHVERLLIEDAEGAVRAKAQDAVASTERDIRSLSGAVATLDAEIASLEREIAAAADRKLRAKAVAELEADAASVSAAALAYIDGARRFAAATAKIASVIPDAAAMHSLATSLAGELPEATALIGNLIRQHAKAIAEGVAPPRLTVAEAPPSPAPAPVPTKRVLSLSALRWGDLETERCAKNQQVALPVELADRALTLGYAIPVTDPRVKSLYAGYGAPPSPAQCVNLADPDLAPFRPAFGADIAAQRANLRETVGPARHGRIGGGR